MYSIVFAYLYTNIDLSIELYEYRDTNQISCCIMNSVILYRIEFINIVYRVIEQDWIKYNGDTCCYQTSYICSNIECFLNSFGRNHKVIVSAALTTNAA